MPPSSQARDPIPEQFATIEAAGDFWDEHDLADYEDLITEAELTFNLERRLPEGAERRRR
jgi:hypothetical protein